jgi:hypothetical protein
VTEHQKPPITKRQHEVLVALKLATANPEGPGYNQLDNNKGWFLASQLTDRNLVSGLDVRTVLLALHEKGLVEKKSLESGRYFRLTKRGRALADEEFQGNSDATTVDSSSWTGIIEPPKVHQALTILAEMEDVCEKMKNNHDRAQIYGLIRALELLLTVPEPPRQGVVALVRDPAFANVIQVATFLTALVAAVKP